jgi:sarcosine oxidase
MAPELRSKTCVYDLPPDEDFTLDELPTSPLITVGIGASHAAKFTSLVGRILADLAPRGRPATGSGPFAPAAPHSPTPHSGWRLPTDRENRREPFTSMKPAANFY